MDWWPNWNTSYNANNQISFAPYYNLSRSDLAKTIGEHFNVLIYLENEANLSVIGEKTFQYDYSNIANITFVRYWTGYNY